MVFGRLVRIARRTAGVAVAAAGTVIGIKELSGAPTEFQHLFKGGTGPRAARRPTEISVFGDTRIDNYYWLRDDKREDKDVLSLCEAENKHMAAGLEGTEELQATMVKEIRSRMKEDDASLPTRRHGYYYYVRMETGKQYPVYCRRKMSDAAAGTYTPTDTMDDASCSGAEEVLHDGNVESKGHSYYKIRALKPSPSHRYISFGRDTVGRESYTLCVYDTQKHTLIAEIENTSGSASWVDDSQLLYTTRDAAHRPDKVWLHTLPATANESDEASVDDVLVFHEPDDTFNVYSARSRSGDYMYIGSSGAVTSEVFVFPTNYKSAKLDAASSTTPQKISLFSVCGRTTNVDYHVCDRDGTFFIVTNAGDAINAKLLALTVSLDEHDPSIPLVANASATINEILPHREDVKLEDVTMYRDFMVVSERRNGLPVLSVHRFSPREKGAAVDAKSIGDGVQVTMRDQSYSLWEGSQEFESSVLRYSYTSQTTPTTTYDIDMHHLNQDPVERKVDPVPGNFDKNNYVSKRIYAVSHDGEKIPISIVHHRDIGTGPHPTVMEGYGAYEISNDVYFSRSVLSLLDRGVVVAVAHVRGGGEMGRRWYENGKYLHKKNTYLDFIACAQELIHAGIAHEDKLCIEGWSAGGLLIGATLNNAPKRSDNKPFFAGAVAGVPFVDVLTTMLDETIPLTAGEWDEWGDPRTPKYYYYMKSYSPIDNVTPYHGPYPPVFIQGGLHDPRVQYWEPLKYAQALRDAGAGTVLCKIDMSSGHFSSSGRFDRLKDTALYFSFMLRAIGQENAALLPNGKRQQ